MHVKANVTSPIVESFTVTLSGDEMGEIIAALGCYGSWEAQDIKYALNASLNDAVNNLRNTDEIIQSLVDSNCLDVLIRDNKPIAAIKIVRNAAGCSLKTAKDAVDQRRAYLDAKGA